ncbi:THUMP domain-containing class I SAM-dependent RNA methyltransferase [Fulvivirga maritima]|uniref:THUMP domain-containing class I SAM-dependent RNA methyltransferase n=1 Tax=Fulvivirga maritima TaxID=2904247 RepID=UPI003F8DFA53
MQEHNKHKIIITCSPRMSPVVEEEVKALGFKNTSINHQNVELMGTFADTLRLNLYLRTANRVLFEIDNFNVNTADELYKKVKKIRWDSIFDVDGYFSIKSYVKNDKILDPRFASLRAKDAIADYFMEKYDRRPNSGKDLSQTVLFLHWHEHEAAIYIDTSGETIAKHGYRKIPMKAPMMESLAAGTILASAWDQKSHFINPMCGSGTLAIEAALIAKRKFLNISRENFGFMHVKYYNADIWERMKQEAAALELKELPFKIIATDLNPAAIVASRQNALTAGVEEFIEFKTCDFRDTPLPEDNKGVIFLNPEYGQRLGEEKALEKTYQEIGDFFKQKASGYLGYIFTGNLNLAKRIGLRTKRRIEFFNAKIDCRLLEYELYAGTKKK